MCFGTLNLQIQRMVIIKSYQIPAKVIPLRQTTIHSLVYSIGTNKGTCQDGIAIFRVLRSILNIFEHMC
jgi:hypothetical protein